MCVYALARVYYYHIYFHQYVELRRSTAARLLSLWVRISPGEWMFVCERCVLSGRGLCDERITRPEEPYRLWCVVLCDLETSWIRRPWPHWGRGWDCCAQNKQTIMLHKMTLCIFWLENVAGILNACRSNTESKTHSFSSIYIFFKLYYSLVFGFDITKAKSNFIFVFPCITSL